MSRHPDKLAGRGKLGWFRALYRYYKDPTASPLGKLVVFLAAIYVVLPTDLVPDVPIIGWLDDLGVMGLATAWLARRVARYRREADITDELHSDEHASSLLGSRSP